MRGGVRERERAQAKFGLLEGGNEKEWHSGAQEEEKEEEKRAIGFFWGEAGKPAGSTSHISRPGR